MADIDVSKSAQTSDLPPDLIQLPVDADVEPRRKIDLSQAIKLYFDNGLPEAEIARHFDCSPQALNQALKPYKQLMLGGNELQTFRDNRVRIKDSIEYNLLLDISDPQKREAASLNNVAYAYRQIHETRRLDEGLSTANVDLHAEFESLKQLREAKDQLQAACGGAGCVQDRDTEAG